MYMHGMRYAKAIPPDCPFQCIVMMRVILFCGGYCRFVVVNGFGWLCFTKSALAFLPFPTILRHCTSLPRGCVSASSIGVHIIEIKIVQHEGGMRNSFDFYGVLRP